jgi:hypothetical protein
MSSPLWPLITCPGNNVSACDNGGVCGACFMLVARDDCWLQGNLYQIADCSITTGFGSFCEADTGPHGAGTAGCGTTNAVNNCFGGFDVYVRVRCNEPPGPPAPPSLPPSPPMPPSPPLKPPPLPSPPPPPPHPPGLSPCLHGVHGMWCTPDRPAPPPPPTVSTVHSPPPSSPPRPPPPPLPPPSSPPRSSSSPPPAPNAETFSVTTAFTLRFSRRL